MHRLSFFAVSQLDVRAAEPHSAHRRIWVSVERRRQWKKYHQPPLAANDFHRLGKLNIIVILIYNLNEWNSYLCVLPGLDDVCKLFLRVVDQAEIS